MGAMQLYGRLFLVGAALVLSMQVGAGPLNPTSGPNSTGKVLSELEPRTALTPANTPGNTTTVFRITKSGSYYLTNNVGGKEGISGIEIHASDVSIDLMGFTMTGGKTSVDGIRTVGVRNNITISNGTISAWDGMGVNLMNGLVGETRSEGTIIEGVRVLGSGSIGVNLGEGSTIRNCQIVDNGNVGIRALDLLVVESSMIASNASHGILSGDAAMVNSTASRGNGTAGINVGVGSSVTNCTTSMNNGSGIVTGDGSSVSHCSSNLNNASGYILNSNASVDSCTAANNGGAGINTGATSTVTNAVATGNAGNGVIAGESSTIVGSTVTGNTLNGASVGSGSVVTDCTAKGNSDNGISGGLSALVVRCNAYDNDQNGISVGTGSTVLDCVAGSNTWNGIYVAGDSIVRGNMVTSNGSRVNDAGIYAVNDKNLIDGNHVIDNHRWGVYATASYNVVVRNMTRGQTGSGSIGAFYLPAETIFLGAAGVRHALPVVGNHGGTIPGTNSEHPLANLAY